MWLKSLWASPATSSQVIVHKGSSLPQSFNTSNDTLLNADEFPNITTLKVNLFSLCKFFPQLCSSSINSQEAYSSNFLVDGNPKNVEVVAEQHVEKEM